MVNLDLNFHRLVLQQRGHGITATDPFCNQLAQVSDPSVGCQGCDGNSINPNPVNMPCS